MRLLSPQSLWLLLPLSVLPVIWYFLERRAFAQLARFASPSVLPSMTLDLDPARRRTRFILGFLALVFGVLALARPQMGTREEVLQSEGLDMVVLLDVSNSMLAEDVVPSRLKKAKHIVKNFADRLSGDRLGIVAFAGSAYPAVPLTTDYEFVRQTLEVLDESAIGNQGSNLARAVEVGMELLVRGGVNDYGGPDVEQADDASRVMVIISDGEATEGEESKLGAKLKELGVRVYAIGVGSTKGGPIPIRDQMGYLRGYKKDPAGNMVLTKLETRNLEAIASKSGGKYYSASSNEGEVQEILGQLSSMERSTGAGRRVIVYDELFQYPLAVALALFLAMLGMRDTGRRKKAATSIAALLALGVFGGASNAHAVTTVKEYDETRKGVKAYEDGDFAGAAQHFGSAQASNPDVGQHHLNLGDALLKSGAPEAAIKEFEPVVKSKDPKEAARGAYNLGKAYEAQNDFEKALRSYQAGLDRLREGDKSNDPEVELRIKRALEQAEQQKQQQKEKQGQGGGQGEQKQDDKKQNQDDKKQQANQKYQIPRKKPQFKPEKLSETDAKRILQQLQEGEKKTQQRVMRNKTGKPKSDKNEKDW